jgi:plastocyanin
MKSISRMAAPLGTKSPSTSEEFCMPSRRNNCVRRHAAAIAFVLAFAGRAHAATHTIEARVSATFVPAVLNIDVGDTVTWENKGGLHNVQADDGSFRNGNAASNAWTFSRTFTTPGTVRYFCEIHGAAGGVGMAGLIQVNAAGSPGAIGFADDSVTAGEAAGTVTLVVTRTGGTEGAVAVNFATANGTATAGADYTAASGTLNWANGDGSNRNVVVTVLDDGDVEPSETILLNLATPSGGATSDDDQATITLTDNDVAASPGKLQFQSASVSAKEGTSATLGVARTQGTSGAVSVQWSAGGGTATLGTDYTAAGATISFANGEGGVKTFTVPLATDDLLEGDETANFNLANPTGGATLGVPATSVLTLRDANLAPGDVTGDEEACEEIRLRGWFKQLRVTAPGSTKKVGLTLAPTAGGHPFGVAFTANGPTAESHLAFAIDPEETPFKRDPTKALVETARLTRNEVASDLVAKTSPDRLQVSLNPGNAPNPPAATLGTVDNINPLGLVSAVRSGKPLRPLLAGCQTKTTDADLHVLRVLTQVLRPSSTAAKTFTAIYRGEGSDRYRADVYPLNPGGQATLGRLAVEIDVDFDNQGNLLHGSLHVLPRCVGATTTGCTNSGALGLDVLKPAKTGALSPAPVAGVSTNGTDGSGQPDATFDWADVLGTTLWKKPL